MDQAKQIQIFKDLFMNRVDLYPCQRIDGTWILCRQPLTDDIIRKHLDGQVTIGMYSSAESTTKWLCIDIDRTEIRIIIRMINKLDALELSFYIEFSGKKGFHIWIFFSDYVENHKARLLGKYLSETGMEVFPKQDKLEKGKLGNLIKLPLGKHQVSGKYCLFYTKELELYHDQWELLGSVKKVVIYYMLNKLNLDKSHTGNTETNRKTQIPGLIKPCILDLISTSMSCGIRNRAAYIIATELRRLNCEKNSTKVILMSWNIRNNPPLEPWELDNIIHSAYSNLHEYGCSSSSAIHSVINCIGQDKCIYYKSLCNHN
jgi:hypothetical protein